MVRGPGSVRDRDGEARSGSSLLAAAQHFSRADRWQTLDAQRREVPLLDLDDRGWAELEHAYGSAVDIPPLLRQLRTFPPARDYQSQPYFSLWSALCHQGDVYTASYAAVPHLVDALLASPSPVYDSPLQLVTCIEIARANGHGPVVPIGLAAAYSAALRRLPEVVRAMVSSTWDEKLCRVAAAALAVANGHARLAEAILELEPSLLDDFMAWVAER